MPPQICAACLLPLRVSALLRACLLPLLLPSPPPACRSACLPLRLPACRSPALRFRLPSCCLPALCFAALPAALPAALLLLRCALPAAAPLRVSALLRLPPALPLFRRSAAPLGRFRYLYTFAAFRPLICRLLCLLSCAFPFPAAPLCFACFAASIRGRAACSASLLRACRRFRAACFCLPLRRLRFRLRLLPLLPSCLPPCFFLCLPSCRAACRLRASPAASVLPPLLRSPACIRFCRACLLSCCLPAALLPAVLLLPCRVPLSFVRFRYSPKARRVPALPLLLPSAAILCCVWYLCTFAPLRVLCRPFSAPLPAVPAPPLLCLPACLL